MVRSLGTAAHAFSTFHQGLIQLATAVAQGSIRALSASWWWNSGLAVGAVPFACSAALVNPARISPRPRVAAHRGERIAQPALSAVRGSR